MAPSTASLADVFAPGAAPEGATSSLAANLAEAARCIRFFKRIGRVRHEFRRQRRNAGEPLRLHGERHRSARRWRRGVDAAARTEDRAAEIRDREALDDEPARVEFEHGGRALGVDPRIDGAAEFEREGDLTGTLEGGAGERVVGERNRAVEIDLGGADRGVEARRPLIGREHVGEPPLDRLAVDLRLEALDREALGAERHVAARP